MASLSSIAIVHHGISHSIVRVESSFFFCAVFFLLLFSLILFEDLRIIFFGLSTIITFIYLLNQVCFEDFSFVGILLLIDWVLE